MTDQSVPELGEHEAKDEAVFAILGAWNVGLSKGVPMEVMAITAINAALTDIYAAYGEAPTLQVLEDMVEKVKSGHFALDDDVSPSSL